MRKLHGECARIITDARGRRRVATRSEEEIIKESAESKLAAVNEVLRQAAASRNYEVEREVSRVLAQKFLPPAIDQMTRLLTEEFGNAAAKPIAQLLAADKERGRRPMSLRFYMDSPCDPYEMRPRRMIRGTIPELNYQFVVEDF